MASETLMCGRYAVTLPPEAVRAFFSYVEQPNFPPRFNVAPTQPIAIVRRNAASPDPTQRHFGLVRWGFVPAFAKTFDAFKPFVNARSEGLIEKASFRNAFRRRRCLVIADGFYEWQQRPTGRSQPFLVRRTDRAPFGMAGLTETWVGADGSEIDTACIVTAAAVGQFATVHHRMPVIIQPGHFDLWLDPDERRTAEAAGLLEAVPEQLELVPIGPAVNKVVNDDASIQTPTSEPIIEARHRVVQGAGDRQGSLF